MAREIIIRQWCDIHLAEHEQQVEGQPVQMTISRTGPLVIDLCEQHINELIKPMLDLLVMYGNRPEVRELASRGAPKRRVVKRPAEGSADPVVAQLDSLLASESRKGRGSGNDRAYQCLWCPLTYGSSSGFAEHLLLHGFTRSGQGSTLQDGFGTVCPMCFKDDVHVLSGHAKRSHKPLENLTELFTVAAAQGDPYGVVAARLKAAPVTANTHNSLEDLVAVGVKLAVAQPAKRARKTT